MSVKPLSFISEQSSFFYLAIISFTLIAFSIESCTNSAEQNQIEQHVKSTAITNTTTALDKITILINYLK